MEQISNQLVLLKDDYTLLLSYLNSWHGKSSLDRRNAEDLYTELKKARIVNKEAFPPDVVRLNSKVKINPDGSNDVMELILVTPDKANIDERKISVMAPIGTALIGFRQGQKINWRVPAGRKSFTITNVINEIH